MVSLIPNVSIYLHYIKTKIWPLGMGIGNKALIYVIYTNNFIVTNSVNDCYFGG